MPSNEDEIFDWDAFYRDTRVLSPDARGAWWDCLFHQRLSPIRGRISMPMASYASIFGVSPARADSLIEEIGDRGVGDVVTEDNGKVTVINRRMFRQWQEREANKNRQAAYRERQAEAERNGNVTKAEKTPLLEEEKNKKEEKKREKSAAMRIPDPFPLTDERIDWAAENCPGLHVIDAHENFVEYWTNNTTAKARKMDWDRAWQKGMRLALGWQKQNEINQRNNGNGKPTNAQRLRETGEHLAAKYKTEAELAATGENAGDDQRPE